MPEPAAVQSSKGNGLRLSRYLVAREDRGGHLQFPENRLRESQVVFIAIIKRDGEGAVRQLLAMDPIGQHFFQWPGLESPLQQTVKLSAKLFGRDGPGRSRQAPDRSRDPVIHQNAKRIGLERTPAAAEWHGHPIEQPRTQRPMPCPARIPRADILRRSLSAVGGVVPTSCFPAGPGVRTSLSPTRFVWLMTVPV